jgi:hypothetical protein
MCCLHLQCTFKITAARPTRWQRCISLRDIKTVIPFAKSLFNDAANSSDYEVSNVWMMNNELGGRERKKLWPNLRYCLGILMV